ncbi:cytochrome c oxidase assembly protein [Nocardia sp. CNY236]|uniref:cytochrome c oxidase assembly protein n=1 Tax=Nocardia sp. CNY236 TaxID=1169152 RepID=UPI0004203E76|nr:cytochrome c oxidase assembly protein [Nocardia sp. CNY236]
MTVGAISARTVWFVSMFGAVVLLVVAAWSAQDFPYRAAGTAYPGLGHAALYTVLRAVAMVAGSVTVGALVYSACCTAVGKHGRLGVDGYAGIRVVERASVVWVAAAVALIPVTAADVGGIAVSEMLRGGALGSLIDASEKPKAWMVVAALAAVVAVGSRFSLSWVVTVALAWIAAIGVVPPFVVGNAGEGPGHDYATGAALVLVVAMSVPIGLLWCVSAHLGRGGDDAVALVRRTRFIVVLCLSVAAICGVVLVAVLVPPSQVFVTGYGRLVLGAGLSALLVAVLVGRMGCGPKRDAVVCAVAGGAALVAMSALSGAGVGPAPAFADRQFTAHQVGLGFDIADPPSALRLLTFWRFDIVLGGAALVGIGMYVLGVLRLRRRGDAWSVWRTVSWVGGCVVLSMATSSGIGAYGYAMFSWHMVTHMALNMVVPVLLVLGAPATLLLRALPAAPRGALWGVREGVLALVHSRLAALLSHPVFSVTAFVVSLYGLYFTPAFESLIPYHWGHVFMNMHFLIVGYLYYWAIIGIDPGPRRLPHVGRLGVLFAVMPFHAFFGVSVMSMTTVIGERFYAKLQLPWGVDLLADQRVGGAIAWVAGEVPILIVVGALLTQWVAQDRRVAVRTDRKDDVYGDSDLDAYNAMLVELARTRGR